MTRDEVIELLRGLNPTAKLGDVIQYADCFLTYAEASKNIAENGAIVAHPRTGNPIENPYLSVQAAVMKNLANLRKVSKTDALWESISKGKLDSENTSE